jgi:hypothetical protein
MSIRYCLTFAFLLLLPFGFASAQATIGFVNDTVWYSKDPFVAGEKIQIITSIFNRDTRELSGTVSFYDENILLGKKDFVVPGKNVKDVSIDWTASAGTHSVFARIDSAKFKLANGKTETVSLQNTRTLNNDSNVRKSGGSKEEPDSIRNIQNIVTAQTPNIISKPILYLVEKMENFRKGLKIPLAGNKYVFYGVLLCTSFFIVRKILHLLFGR